MTYMQHNITDHSSIKWSTKKYEHIDHGSEIRHSQLALGVDVVLHLPRLDVSGCPSSSYPVSYGLRSLLCDLGIAGGIEPEIFFSPSYSKSSPSPLFVSS